MADSFRDFGSGGDRRAAALMEEQRDDLVVIVAGYEGEMASLPGREPRAWRHAFPPCCEFPDYTDDELVAIFAAMAANAGYTVQEGMLDAVRARVRAAERGESFGNARMMRNLLDRAISLQARRLTTVDGSARVDAVQVRQLRADDLPDQTRAKERPTGQYL